MQVGVAQGSLPHLHRAADSLLRPGVRHWEHRPGVNPHARLQFCQGTSNVSRVRQSDFRPDVTGKLHAGVRCDSVVHMKLRTTGSQTCAATCQRVVEHSESDDTARTAPPKSIVGGIQLQPGRRGVSLLRWRAQPSGASQHRCHSSDGGQSGRHGPRGAPLRAAHRRRCKFGT
jgi:hypothetical protein